MIYHHFSIPNFTWLLIITMKPKAKENIYTASILLFYIIHKYFCSKNTIFFWRSLTIGNFRILKLVGLLFLLSYKITCLPFYHHWLYELKSATFLYHAASSCMKISDPIQKFECRYTHTTWWCQMSMWFFLFVKESMQTVSVWDHHDVSVCQLCVPFQLLNYLTNFYKMCPSGHPSAILFYFIQSVITS
jgi:hypothetical protein